MNQLLRDWSVGREKDMFRVLLPPSYPSTPTLLVADPVSQLDVPIYTFWFRNISHMPIPAHHVFCTGYIETKEFVDDVRGGNASNVGWKEENQTCALSGIWRDLP